MQAAPLRAWRPSERGAFRRGEQNAGAPSNLVASGNVFEEAFAGKAINSIRTPASPACLPSTESCYRPVLPAPYRIMLPPPSHRVICRTPGARRQAGFSLVEVLVSVLVLAIGLIGAAMMQINAARTTQESSLHDTALGLAVQIADEIRANDAQARQAPGSNPFLDLQYANTARPSSASTDCYRQTCSTVQIAQQSAAEWQQRVYDMLPGGRLEICRDAGVVDASSGRFNWCGAGTGAAGAPVTIKIGWTERDTGGPALRDIGGAGLGDTSPRIAVVLAPYSQ